MKRTIKARIEKEKVIVKRNERIRFKAPIWGRCCYLIGLVHFGRVGSCSAVDEPTFVASVFLMPAVVGFVGVHLATAQGVVLRSDGVLKPD